MQGLQKKIERFRGEMGDGSVRIFTYVRSWGRPSVSKQLL